MGPTNIVAHELEGHDIHMFSAKEMAFNILGLMKSVDQFWQI